MPRASWSGFLRLSLVSCPVYLSPATTRTKSLRLHQVWRPAAADEPGPESRIEIGTGRLPPDQERSQPIRERPSERIKPPGSRCAHTTQGPGRKSRSRKSSRDTNTAAASSLRLQPRS
jgi:hypothetical protein